MSTNSAGSSRSDRRYFRRGSSNSPSSIFCVKRASGIRHRCTAARHRMLRAKYPNLSVSIPMRSAAYTFRLEELCVGSATVNRSRSGKAPSAAFFGLSHERTYRSPFLLKRSSQVEQRRRVTSWLEVVFDIVRVITTGFGFLSLGSRAPIQRAAGRRWLFRNSLSRRHSLHRPIFTFILTILSSPARPQTVAPCYARQAGGNRGPDRLPRLGTATMLTAEEIRDLNVERPRELHDRSERRAALAA